MLRYRKKMILTGLWKFELRSPSVWRIATCEKSCGARPSQVEQELALCRSDSSIDGKNILHHRRLIYKLIKEN